MIEDGWVRAGVAWCCSKLWAVARRLGLVA